MADKDHWICPECRILCAIEVKFSPENIVWCICNNSNGNCNYSETVTETKKRLKENDIINREGNKG